MASHVLIPSNFRAARGAHACPHTRSSDASPTNAAVVCNLRGFML